MTNTSPVLAEYSDYRAFLGDWIKHRMTLRRVSFRWFSQQFGFSSPNYVQAILDGSRNLSLAAGNRVAAALKLKDDERRYFLLLVRLALAGPDIDSTNLIADITRARARLLMAKRTDKSYYTSFLYSVIWELFDLHPQGLSAELLTSMLDCTIEPGEIDATLEYLHTQGLIKPSSTMPKAWDKSNTTEFAPVQDVPMEELRRCHERMLGEVQRRVHRDIAERELQGLVIAVSRDKMPDFRARVRRFIVELNEEFSTQDAGRDSVVQVHCSVVRLTR